MCEAGWEKLCGAAGSGGRLWGWDGMSETGQLPVRQPVELLAVQLVGDSWVAVALALARRVGRLWLAV